MFLCSVISGKFRHSHFIISSVFPGCSDVFPSFMFHHFRILSSFLFHQLFSSFPDYSVVFSVFYVPSFPEIPVIHMSSLFSSFPYGSVVKFHHFRKFAPFIFHHVQSIYCLGFASFMFRHFRIIPSFFSLSCFRTWYFIMSGLFRRFFPSLMFISGNFRHPHFSVHHFLIIASFFQSFMFRHFRKKFPSFIFHHFPDYSVVVPSFGRPQPI